MAPGAIDQWLAALERQLRDGPVPELAA